MPDQNSDRRLTPDVSAVADPFTGVKIVFNGKQLVGGGTSQSAPIWAGVAAVMNQYLIANGGRALGDLNPLLYKVAEGARFPGFRDVVLGGNAVDTAGPGYDLVTGLGTPDVDNLVRNILILQKVSRVTHRRTRTHRTHHVSARSARSMFPQANSAGSAVTF